MNHDLVFPYVFINIIIVVAFMALYSLHESEREMTLTPESLSFDCLLRILCQAFQGVRDLKKRQDHEDDNNEENSDKE